MHAGCWWAHTAPKHRGKAGPSKYTLHNVNYNVVPTCTQAQHSHVHPWASFGFQSCLAQAGRRRGRTGRWSTPPAFPPVPGRISFQSYSVPRGSGRRQDLCLPCWSCWGVKLVLDRRVAKQTFLFGSILCPFQYGYLTDVTAFTFKRLACSQDKQGVNHSLPHACMCAGMCFCCVLCFL